MLTVDIDSNSGFCAGVIRAIGKAEVTVTDGKFLGFAAHKLNELFVDYLYDLLVGGEGFRGVLKERPK